MKKFIIIVLCLITLIGNTQSISFEEALKTSTEILPEQISNQYPLFFKVLLSSKLEDNYITKVAYGEFEGKFPIRYINNKGVIILDNKYFTSGSTNIESYAIWSLYNNIGTIHYLKDNNKNSVDYEGFKSKFYFAIGKAKEQAEKGYCLTLKTGINNVVGISKNATDLNLKQAALDVTNDNLFKQMVELSKLKGCPIETNQINSNTLNNSQTNSSTNNNQQSSQTTTTSQINEEEILGNLKVKIDNITKSVIYYDKRTGYDNLYGEGLYASLFKSQNKYLLRTTYYHISTAAEPATITKILVNVGENEPINLKFKPFIGVNSMIESVVSKNAFYYKLLKKAVENKTCMMRIYYDNGRATDYSLGKREISEIATILDAYEKLNGLN